MGWYPGTSPDVPSPSSGGVVVALSPADLSSPSPVATVLVHAHVVPGVTFYYSLPRRRLRFHSPFPVFPSASPLSVLSSRWVWGARLEHQPRHRNVTQKRATLWHSHRAVLLVDVGPHSQQASTARQAECAGAVVCSAGAVAFSFPPFPPSIFTVRLARFAWSSLYLTPSIAKGDVADVTSKFRRVPRWPYVFPTRRFVAQFYESWISPPPPLV